MTTIRNLQVLLDVDPRSQSYTCRGTTKAGERCRNLVSKADRTKLVKKARRLDILAQHQPTSTAFDDAIEDTLQDIAKLCLCKRDHRETQVNDIVTKWTDIIAEPLPRPQRESLSSPATLSRVDSTLSRYMRSSAPSPSMTRASSRLSVSRTSRDPAPSRPNTTRPQSPRRSPTTTSAPEDDLPSSIRASATPHTHHTHEVTRRPITEPCGICCETIHTLDDAVWCRAECGQNIHRECWDLWSVAWLSQKDADADEEELPSCVYCRAPWVEIETAPSPDSHGVTRKPITEDCAICLEGIRHLDDAVWCRGQCGQNVHGHCWDRWSMEQSLNRSSGDTDVDAPPACVFCRAPWVE
ncbi:hypothetical protein N431DRAFT_430930 [Stipitochalara longipes BDJ]|nr:hypothetical protein N431DRAFT_430930 [Stipitochalara longipes BDJ]